MAVRSAIAVAYDRGMPDRLSLIAQRAAAMPVKVRTCAHCLLEYRHTAGVTYRTKWYCDDRCRKSDTAHGRSVTVFLRAIVNGPIRT